MARPSRSQAVEPFPLYHDEFFTQPNPIVNHAPMPSAPNPPRQPLQSTNSNVVLNPPSAIAAKQSPFKPNARPSNTPLAPLGASQSCRLNTVQMVAPTSAPALTDSLEKRQPVMSRFKTVAKKPQLEFNVQFPGKDTAHPPLYPAPTQQFNLDLENFYQKPCGKRVLMEAAPIKELRPAKKQKTDTSLPPHDAFPPIIDDGSKPHHSYATLIAMAIVRSPQRRLTLSQIYKWISDTYSHYRGPETGWQNSIRHNLSLNKAFIKIERPKEDPGKGNYWSIEPGSEHVLLKEKPSRKSIATAENMPVMSTRLEPSQPQPQPLPQPPRIPAPMLPDLLAVPPGTLPPLPPLNQQQHLAPAPPLPDISSDATIPASDLGLVDEGSDRIAEKDLHEPELYSPLPAAMHSSPPIPKRMEARHSNTPPSHRQPHPSSATKSRHRRRMMSMDDSGYISSLESSAMRPHQQAKLLTSEADRPRLKRGRAEEEIARLRASSYDSPSKGRSYGYPPPSSSPIRQPSRTAGQMLPPLTPAMKLKAPPRPPPSVSPSTNLRLHRESIQNMVDSPYKRATALPFGSDNTVQQTPGFNTDHLWFDLDQASQDNTGFAIFEDAPDFQSLFGLNPLAPHTGSPMKRSMKKRASLSGPLTNVTNTAQVSTPNSASFLKVPSQPPNLLLETPSKVFDGLPSSPTKMYLNFQSPTKMPLINDENLLTYNGSLDGLNTPDFDENDFSGFDMLAGFEKIGANNAQTSRGNKQQPSGPVSFGRSYSTSF
ncbi:Forkhead transcription factor [Collariella sp. IMI 366227]|nr:Forkhead transcription factor [Collariella sp. IMI 366227]